MEPDEIQSVLDRANELLGAGKPEESLRCLEELEQSVLEADDRIERGSLEAWALSELGRGNDALDVLEPLLDEFPQSGRLHSALGVVLSNDGDLDQACDALEHAVALDGTDEVALANLGLVYEQLREYEQSLALYEKALELGAEIDWLLRRKAAMQAELGQREQARCTIKRYLSLAPDDDAQWVALAILHSDDGEFEEAFRCYRAAEQVAPDSTDLRLNWGVTAVRAHEVEIATQQLRYLARLEPESCRPMLLAAFIKEEQGQTDAAAQGYLDAFARARGDDHSELTYALEMAMDFFARQGRADPCARLLEQAYNANACTVEVCEAYREATVENVEEQATWYSLIVEGDYRAGLEEITDPDDEPGRPATRFLRNYQVIARDRDEAVALVSQFAERMGEANVLVREFVNEESIADARVGLYEVERESLVFADNGFA